ncbi:hypothetical protein K458DRAFT_308950 [Lentithecium fluviatile CBS 122367]|uniref:Uncharacterized protein n=1 Tax=Lentithecium fluviatile CBS 122367 TaxID=1168545 RepID=A0A6G1ITN0_9PLEO|nr:hypothetical protein K458DRAFT_308950 [Lentithecium fluviatile CBS 122367]
MVQSRMLGGALSLAIVTTTLTTSVHSELASTSFTPTEINALLKTSYAFAELGSERAVFARQVFANGYNLQMKIAAGFSAAQILGTLMLWRKEQFKVPRG